MRGVWQLSTTLLGTGLARPVLSVVWGIVVLFFWIWMRKDYRTFQWAEVAQIRFAIVLLLVWYLASTIDLWLHQQEITAALGYLLVSPFFEIARVASDVALAWATFLMAWRELRLRFRRPDPWWHVGRGLILVQAMLAAFYIGLFVTLVFLWEFFVDPAVIETIAQGRAGFELAFAAFQFVFCFYMVVGIVAAGWLWSRDEKQIPLQMWFEFGAAMSLFTRSFAELVVVGTTSSASASGIAADLALGRETTFGLFTSLYLFFIWQLVKTVTAGGDAGHPDAVGARVEVRKWILQRLEYVSEQGRAAAPPLEQLLTDAGRYFDDAAHDAAGALAQAGAAAGGGDAVAGEDRDKKKTYMGELYARRANGGGAAKAPKGKEPAAGTGAVNWGRSTANGAGGGGVAPGRGRAPGGGGGLFGGLFGGGRREDTASRTIYTGPGFEMTGGRNGAGTYGPNMAAAYNTTGSGGYGPPPGGYTGGYGAGAGGYYNGGGQNLGGNYNMGGQNMGGNHNMGGNYTGYGGHLPQNGHQPLQPQPQPQQRGMMQRLQERVRGNPYAAQAPAPVHSGNRMGYVN